MSQVQSRDGSRIDYDQRGSGPPVILVAGATQHRAIDQGTPQLAEHLAVRFGVFNYDRRGRGESTDTPPYAVGREIEDIEALIDAAGGKAALFGMSSGAVLALEAGAALGDKVTAIACYEPPIDVEQSPEQSWAAWAEIDGFAQAGDGAGAALAFFRQLEMPAQAIEELRQSPAWPAFAKVGHTIAYDLRILAQATARGLPQHWAGIGVPVLLVNGDASYPFMHTGADALARIIPGAQRQVLRGQSHQYDPAILGPVLLDFFSTAPAIASA